MADRSDELEQAFEELREAIEALGDDVRGDIEYLLEHAIRSQLRREWLNDLANSLDDYFSFAVAHEFISMIANAGDNDTFDPNTLNQSGQAWVARLTRRYGDAIGAGMRRMVYGDKDWMRATVNLLEDRREAEEESVPDRGRVETRLVLADGSTQTLVTGVGSYVRLVAVLAEHAQRLYRDSSPAARTQIVEDFERLHVAVNELADQMAADTPDEADPSLEAAT